MNAEQEIKEQELVIKTNGIKTHLFINGEEIHDIQRLVFEAEPLYVSCSYEINGIAKLLHTSKGCELSG